MNTNKIKKNVFCFSILAVATTFIFGSLTGCMVRTYPKAIERVDLQIRNEGNAGYLLGTPPPGREKVEKETRQIQVFEIELSKPLQILKEKPEDITQETYTQTYRGYEEINIESEEIVYVDDIDVDYTDQVEERTEDLEDTYIVQKNDTLQKISVRPEIYGTYKKWRKIYDANRDQLSAPNKIYPGQTLKIPRD